MKKLLFAGWIGVASAAAADPAVPDIVVFGGVPCGIAAAVTAAREGAKVILIESTRWNGGGAWAAAILFFPRMVGRA